MLLLLKFLKVTTKKPQTVVISYDELVITQSLPAILIDM